MTAPSWRDAAGDQLLPLVGRVLFPRLARRLRWPTRAGPRGLAAYVVACALLHFGSLSLAREAVRVQRTRQELREELGREPSEPELIARMKRTRAG